MLNLRLAVFLLAPLGRSVRVGIGFLRLLNDRRVGSRILFFEATMGLLSLAVMLLSLLVLLCLSVLLSLILLVVLPAGLLLALITSGRCLFEVVLGDAALLLVSILSLGVSLALDGLNFVVQTRVTSILSFATPEMGLDGLMANGLVADSFVATSVGLLGLLVAHAVVGLAQGFIIGALVQDGRVEGGDVEDGAGVLATLLVIVIMRLLAMGRWLGNVLGLLGLLVVLVGRWGGFGDGDGHLLVDFDDLGHRHGDVLNHMHGIGDGMGDLHGVWNWHFDGHGLRNANLLRWDVVFANERSQMLILVVTTNASIPSSIA